MEIIINRKKYNFKDVFTFDKFLDLTNKWCKLIFNYNNENVISKFKKIYNKLLNDDGIITKRYYKQFIYSNFGLSDRQQDSINSLLQRGFDKEFIENYLSKKGKSHSKIMENKYNLIENKIYTYNDYLISNNIEPRCKICGAKLLFRRKTSSNIFEFKRCSNENCLSNTKNSRKKYKAVFDENPHKFDKSKNILCIEYWIKKGYSEDDAKKIISEEQQRRGRLNKGKTAIVNKNYLINKFGEEYTNDFYRKRSIFCNEYWMNRGLTYDDSVKKISEIQKAISTLAQKKFKRENNAKCIEYWIKKGYSEEESKDIISKSQSTFSLVKCIDKYGEEDGFKVWKSRQIKWQKKLHLNNNLHVGYSKISQELFSLLESKSNRKEYIFYGSKNNEYSINDGGKNYVYDFCDLDRRKIIEFNGDIYHGNPAIFKETDTPNPFKKDKTCRELWEYDNTKKSVANKNAFEVLTIWEKDYRLNKNEEINKCLKFLEYE